METQKCRSVELELKRPALGNYILKMEFTVSGNTFIRALRDSGPVGGASVEEREEGRARERERESERESMEENKEGPCGKLFYGCVFISFMVVHSLIMPL